jgi:hypothetical protein
VVQTSRVQAIAPGSSHFPSISRYQIWHGTHYIADAMFCFVVECAAVLSIFWGESIRIRRQLPNDGLEAVTNSQASLKCIRIQTEP